MNNIKIINSKIQNGEFILEIEENGKIKEYELNEADLKFGNKIIDKEYNNYLERVI